jgi:probable HAF family extracellular repeat protein
MVGLGRPPGDYYSYARAVSGDGSVVVGGSDYIDDEYYRFQAFRWTAGGGMQGLGHLPGGGVQSLAVGASANGSVVVGSSDSASASGFEAFRWTDAGGMQGLGDLPGGGFDSTASAVSGDGAVIVGTGTSASGYEAFRWTSAGGMVGLGVLPGDLQSTAYGVNADGSIVVGTSSSASGMHVFRWTSAAGMVGLGNLPSDFDPWGFNADGSVVVGAGPGNASYWTANGGVRTLWDELLSRGVDPAANGWSSLGWAKAVSADGNTIVGDGYRNGRGEAFVAVIPEPTGLALLLATSGALSVRRRRRD